jgi:hypothetical protein
VAWTFATIFVIPLIALEGLGAAGARRQSFHLAKGNWRAESGRLGALQVALLVPGLLFYLAGKLLFEGHVHSLAGEVLLGAVLSAGSAWQWPRASSGRCSQSRSTASRQPSGKS